MSSTETDELLARIRLITAGDGLMEQRQFGGNAFMLNGNMLCCVGKHGMMARVGKEQEAAALAKPYSKPFDKTGRRMGGLINVAPDGVMTDEDLLAWIDMARTFVETLPAKVKKPKASPKPKRAPA